MLNKKEILPLAKSPAGDDDDEVFDTHRSRTKPNSEDLKNILDMHGERFSPILAALREQPWKELITSRDIMDSLSAQGLDLSERTVRLYLAEMADFALIDRHGRRGYKLTETGAEIARELT